jgi:hypothetical protein
MAVVRSRGCVLLLALLAVTAASSSQSPVQDSAVSAARFSPSAAFAPPLKVGSRSGWRGAAKMRSASTPALSPILEKMARKTSASCRSSPVLQRVCVCTHLCFHGGCCVRLMHVCMHGQVSGVMMDAGTETVSVEMAKAATFDQVCTCVCMRACGVCMRCACLV